MAIQVVFSELSGGGHLWQAGDIPGPTFREAWLVQRRTCPCRSSALTRVITRFLEAEEYAWRQLGRGPALASPALVADLPVVVLEDLGVKVEIFVLLIHNCELPRDQLVIFLLLQFELTLAHCVVGVACQRPGLNFSQ